MGEEEKKQKQVGGQVTKTTEREKNTPGKDMKIKGVKFR